MAPAHLRVGLDFSGVLQTAKGPDTGLDDVKALPLMEGAVEGVKKLVDQLGAENVWIVSEYLLEKVPVHPALDMFQEWEHITEYLEGHNFFEVTGFCQDNIVFTAKRNGSEGKWPVIAKLKLNAFVDDKWSMFGDPLIDELFFDNSLPLTSIFFGDAPAPHVAMKLDRDSGDKKNRTPDHPLRCGGGDSKEGAYEKKHSYGDIAKSRNLQLCKDWPSLVNLLLSEKPNKAVKFNEAVDEIPEKVAYEDEITDKVAGKGGVGTASEKGSDTGAFEQNAIFYSPFAEELFF